MAMPYTYEEVLLRDAGELGLVRLGHDGLDEAEKTRGEGENEREREREQVSS